MSAFEFAGSSAGTAKRAASGRTLPTEKQLPRESEAVAPDGSLVRLLCTVASGSMAHFELGPGEVARAVRHRTVDEIWYVLAGSGTMWRQQQDANVTTVDLRPGLSLTIPVGTSFQFRNTGSSPLTAIGVTLPPWPGSGEAEMIEGPWQATVH